MSFTVISFLKVKTISVTGGIFPPFAYLYYYSTFCQECPPPDFVCPKTAVKTVPVFSSLETEIRPPRRSTMSLSDTESNNDETGSAEAENASA